MKTAANNAKFRSCLSALSVFLVVFSIIRIVFFVVFPYRGFQHVINE